MQEEMLGQIAELQRRVELIESVDALPIVARYMTDAGQTITVSTWTIVDFDTADYDPVSAVTTGATWKFTAPIGGYYNVNVFIEMEASSVIQGGDIFYAEVYIDGVSISKIAAWQQPNTGSNSDVYLAGSDTVYLAKDSYLDIRVWHDNSSTVTLHTDEKEVHVSIHHVTQGV